MIHVPLISPKGDECQKIAGRQVALCGYHPLRGHLSVPGSLEVNLPSSRDPPYVLVQPVLLPSIPRTAL